MQKEAVYQNQKKILQDERENPAVERGAEGAGHVRSTGVHAILLLLTCLGGSLSL